MTNQNEPKARITLSSLRIILLAASFTLIAVNSAKAEEIHLGRQVYTEQLVYPVENPAPRTYPQQPVGFHPAQPPKQQAAWKFTIGVAALYKPAFVGSKDYQAIALPDIKVEYEDRFFASLFEGVGYNVIKSEGWRTGPIAKFHFQRREDDDNPFRIAGKKTNALRGLGNVDATPEVGGFVEYSFEPFKYTLELRQGVGGHEGFVVETGLNYTGFTKQLGKRFMYALGPVATFADSNYSNAYFGITQRQSVDSGLAGYRAGSGLVSYGIRGHAVMSVSESVSLGVFAGYDRLGSVASDSPLIKERGDENQFMGAMRFIYKFGH